MNQNEIPSWILNLDKGDIEFIKNLVLYSGSLKQLAKYYEVSYPTVRQRLNNVIEKVKMSEQQEDSSLVSFVRTLAIEEKLELNDAKTILDLYNKERKG
ncbi:DUF2089 family protein [Staphylococcus haemolyticus]|uniref:DUF2089 domain-containing protein n=1 Tax=Staphylococcus haemolyticus TaxID=1283 RepID=A0AB38PF56_STAHA|nr:MULTISPECIES: DUF2089 family protein [Staphylococcus]KAA2275691.1 DUF2089 domain-containing protein [Staphylococcus sp. GDX7P312P]KAA2282275.1 DUF2089 domain-containing protein [Staphylococcus sp. GDX7P459A]MCE4953706.1 DUF2089 family protein [Staphylococcus haemolyticus]MCE4964065.1 DUF2089 family protein [Staphylococcus haemolyticus]MCE4987426.1 DUF2089 family protein [Staphylococcus haemolyticus]